MNAAKAIQKKWAVFSATLRNESDEFLFSIDGTLVEACRPQWSLIDKDGDRDFTGPSDSMKVLAECGKGLPTILGLTPEETDVFVAAFGDNPSCKLSGVPQERPQCFRGDTLVWTKTGMRPIRDLKVGDLVWSVNEASGEEVLRPVTQNYRRAGTALRAVSVSGDTIYTTDEHPFRVVGKGWVKAAELASGDQLLSRGGARVAVAANQRVDGAGFYAGFERGKRSSGIVKTSAKQPAPGNTPGSPASIAPIVYNMEIADTHNYFVGPTRILVHNGK